MHACALLALSMLLHPAQAPVSPRSILVLPMEARLDASRDLAVLLTTVVAGHASKAVPTARVTTLHEVEGMMTQEQLKQVAGCDTVSCAAEIAGSLNADEIIMGTLGRVGDSYVLTLTRVGRNGVVHARVVERVAPAKDDLLLDGLAAWVPRLMADGGAPVAEPLRNVTPQDSVPATRPPPRGRTEVAHADAPPPSALAKDAGDDADQALEEGARASVGDAEDPEFADRVMVGGATFASLAAASLVLRVMPFGFFLEPVVIPLVALVGSYTAARSIHHRRIALVKMIPVALPMLLPSLVAVCLGTPLGGLSLVLIFAGAYMTSTGTDSGNGVALMGLGALASLLLTVTWFTAGVLGASIAAVLAAVLGGNTGRPLRDDEDDAALDVFSVPD